MVVFFLERIRNQKGDFILYYTDGDIKENKDFVIKEIPISPGFNRRFEKRIKINWNKQIDDLSCVD